MIMIACVDEKNGMLFHSRRQSQDKVLREDVARECGERNLYMNAYSYAMFGQDTGISLKVSEDFLNQAGDGDYCFVENQPFSYLRKKIEGVVLYQWNRRYPADTYFPLDFADGSWELERVEELKGYSHERITKEVYKSLPDDGNMGKEF